jgi:hypothetical protein
MGQRRVERACAAGYFAGVPVGAKRVVASNTGGWWMG